MLAGIRNSHAAPPRQKEAILPEDLIAMLETLDRGTLRGLRDRAMLLLGFAGGLRRSEIIGLDVLRDQTQDGRGWIEILERGLLVTLRGKTGWREVEIGRGSADATCPVVALQTWLRLARIGRGPLFRRVTGQGKQVGAERLNDQEVARLVKRTALAAGVRGDLSEGDRATKFSGHSLRAGLASSAEVDERYVQKQLGHTSAEMTRRYQRRRPVSRQSHQGQWTVGCEGPSPALRIAGAPLSPGQLVLRQPAARVEYSYLMGEIWTPVPKDKVAILHLGARREARNHNAGKILGSQPVVDGPGRRALSGAESSRPGTGVERHRKLSPPLFRCQIRDVVTIDLIGAKHARIDPLCEALVGLLDCRHDGQCQIECRHAFGIESGASDRRSFAGSRLECPTWIVCAVAGSDDPHANPPTAM
ncbi:hypothetical protein X738_33270 [Mesorhizobium sp. LNHC209A00]|nr:hypothetical protein X738_33270 [Mesorhizobium sp. LNHC209A00]